MRRFRITYFFLFILICNSVMFAGRGDKAGTAAAAELLIPIGSRTIALGCSPLATISGVEAMYWNPAGLSRSDCNTGLIFSHVNYFADIGVDYFGVGTKLFDLGYIGFAFKSLSFGEIKVTTELEPDGTGELTSPTFVIVGGSFSRKVTDRISFGITSNFIYEKMARVSASSFAFDLGVQYSNIGGVEGLSVGAVVRNIGPSLKYDGSGLLRTAKVIDANRSNSTVKIEAASSDLPSTIEIGLGYTMPVAEQSFVDITSTFQNNNFSDDEYKFGVEYNFKEILFMRTGYSFASTSEMNEYIFGPTVGIGLQSSIGDIKINIDYAYRAVKYLHGNHVITILIGI